LRRIRKRIFGKAGHIDHYWPESTVCPLAFIVIRLKMSNKISGRKSIESVLQVFKNIFHQFILQFPFPQEIALIVTRFNLRILLVNSTFPC
jgi:hypothetical protein